MLVMKKRILFLCFFWFCFLSGVEVVRAQEEDWTSVYQKYLSSVSDYKASHSNYVLAKNQHLQAGTLASGAKAMEATSNMLLRRDEVVVGYFDAVEFRLGEAVGVEEGTKEGLRIRIEDERSWWGGHKSGLLGAGTLDDLVDDSDEAREHWEVFGAPLAYEILSEISLGKVSLMRERVYGVLEEVRREVSRRKEESPGDYSVVDRWVVEAESKISRSEEKETEARTLIYSFDSDRKSAYGRKDDKAYIYENILSLTRESYQLLKESYGNLGEVLYKLAEG
jgi:hypothetical protein